MHASDLLRPVRLPPQEKRELEPIRNSCATIRLCQMSLDGSLADLEPARDLLVACPLTDQIRDHALPLGEGFERRLRSQCLLAGAQEGLQFSDQPGDEVPWEPELTVLQRSQHLLEVRGIYAPGAVPSGAGLERQDPFCFGGSIRQGKDLRRRAQPMDRLEAVRPVEPGESQIENQDLRLEMGRDPPQGPWLGDRADGERLLKSFGPEPATLGQDAGNDDGDLPTPFWMPEVFRLSPGALERGRAVAARY